MLYKAYVKDKVTKERLFIEFDSPTKKQFIKDLRSDGYTVTDQRVKESKLFDWILDNTNAENADWHLKEIPIDRDEYYKKIEEYLKRRWQN